MEWGIDRKLKEHTAMLDSKIDSKVLNLQAHINKVDNDFNLYKLDCLEHRRRSEDWVKTMTLSQHKTELSQENTDKNVQCIKNILEDNLPNMRDLEEKRATKHQIKELALWVSAVLGALITAGVVILAIAGYFNGFFVK